MGLKVGVIGLGTMGSMAAWQLAKRGVEVTGFEQFGIGHDRSAAGGESRLFRTAYLEGVQYVPLLREAKKLWRELEQESGRELLTLNGGLTIGPEHTNDIKNVLKSINDFNIDHEVFSLSTARQLFPQHKFTNDDVVILDKEAGFIRPELSVVTAVNMAEKLGANIYRNTKIIGFEQRNDHVVVKANNGEFKFDHILVTAGPWASELIPQYKQVLHTRRIVMSWFIPHDLQKYQVNQFHTFARTTASHDFFGLPTLDNSMVKVALVNTFGDVEDPKALNHNLEWDEVAEHAYVANTYFNDLHPDPVRLSIHMDVYTPDEHAIVGIVPGHPNVSIMTGFSGHGFKFAPIMGKIASQLVIDGKTDRHIAHLNSSRFNKHYV